MAETLRDQQYTLARYLRDPATNPPPPGIEARRLKVYGELFFNAIEGLLAGSFPVIRATLGDANWKRIVRSFYARHRSRTPLFPEVASEFVAYLEAHADSPDMPPWLSELAHYEWVEQALFISDAKLPAHDPDGDLLSGVPLLSPLARPLAYRWAVTEIGPDNVPQVPPTEVTTLLVYRDGDSQVRFARIAPLVYLLLVSLEKSVATGHAQLAALASEMGVDAAEMQAHGSQLLLQLRTQGVVLGTVVNGGLA